MQTSVLRKTIHAQLAQTTPTATSIKVSRYVVHLLLDTHFTSTNDDQRLTLSADVCEWGIQTDLIPNWNGTPICVFPKIPGEYDPWADDGGVDDENNGRE